MTGSKFAKLAPTGLDACVATPYQAMSVEYDRLNPTNQLLLTRSRLAFDGPLDPAIVREVVEELVARHTVLGSRFSRGGSSIRTQISPSRHQIPCDVVSFEARTTDQQSTQWDELFAELGRPFDLATGPLLRCNLVRLAPERHVLACVIHHIAFDRGSMKPFVAELAAGYRARTLHTPWPAPALQYIDFAAYLEAVRASAAGAAQRAYWDRALVGALPLELPLARPRDAVDAARDGNPLGIAFRPIAPEAVEGVVEPALQAQCTNLARTEMTSNFVLIVTALAVVLHRMRGQQELTFQTRLSLRRKPALANVIGPVGTSVVTRIDLSGTPTFRELIARVRTVTLASWSNAEVPVIDRVPHGLRRLNVNYVPVEGSDAPTELAPGVTVTELRTPLDLAKVRIPWDIQLWIQDASDRCRMRMVYLAELFDRATMVGIVDGTITTLREMCEKPDKLVD